MPAAAIPMSPATIDRPRPTSIGGGQRLHKIGGMDQAKPARTVRVLDLDPDLCSRLRGGERERAARELEAPLYWLSPGVWNPPRTLHGRGPLGLLVVDGLLARQVEVSKARCIELLSGGDLLRPWQPDAASFVEVRWQVLMPTRAVLLTAEFTARACRYPSVVDALVERAIHRSRSLAVHSAIDNVVGLRQSLELLFWHLAERWGKVSPDGIVMPLQLTHQMLADLVGARRPSVSAALREMAEDGVLARIVDRGWLLYGSAPNSTVPGLEAQPT